MPVVTGAGLVGNVVRVTSQRSVIRLVTDPTFAVGVSVPTAEDDGIAKWRRTTLPTSPAPVTTGMPSLIPAPTPRLISIVASKFDGVPDTTRAATVGTSPK